MSGLTRREMVVHIIPAGAVRRRPPRIYVTRIVDAESVRRAYRRNRRWGDSPLQARNAVLSTFFVDWTVSR